MGGEGGPEAYQGPKWTSNDEGGEETLLQGIQTRGRSRTSFICRSVRWVHGSVDFPEELKTKEAEV